MNEWCKLLDPRILCAIPQRKKVEWRGQCFRYFSKNRVLITKSDRKHKLAFIYLSKLTLGSSIQEGVIPVKLGIVWCVANEAFAPALLRYIAEPLLNDTIAAIGETIEVTCVVNGEIKFEEAWFVQRGIVEDERKIRWSGVIAFVTPACGWTNYRSQRKIHRVKKVALPRGVWSKDCGDRLSEVLCGRAQHSGAAKGRSHVKCHNIVDTAVVADAETEQAHTLIIAFNMRFSTKLGKNSILNRPHPVI